MKRFSDIVSISSDINHASTGNQVRGVLIRKEENVTLPSGRTLFRRRKEGENTMLIGVTQLVAEFLTGKRTNKIEVLTLDKDLESTITATSSIVKNDLNYCGVMLCNGGADGAVVKAVNRYAPGFTAATRIPWRMVKKSADDPNTLYQTYACRSVEGNDVKYYLKKLKKLDWVNRTVDGEQKLTNRPENSLSGSVAVETVIQTEFAITLQDLTEYYRSIGENVRRKFSTICLFIGNTVNVLINGSTYQDHRNLLCANQLNIEEEYLKQNKEAEYEYNVHFR